jgi:SAM-dependent methyltransferase
MDERLMKAMLEVDDRHWWYRGRRLIVRAELDHLAHSNGERVLDAGCGSGRMLEELKDYGEVSGVEIDRDAAAVAVSRGWGEVWVGSLEALPWEAGTFDLITCLDVLEHIADDRRTLTELRRVCKVGGFMLLTVPAYPRLWSLHDVANHHYRRYSRRSLRVAAIEAGWKVVRMTAFNSILLVPAALVRIAQRGKRPGLDYTPEITLGPEWLNAVLEQPLRAEARWLARGRTLPAGLSLLAVLQNAGNSS